MGGNSNRLKIKVGWYPLEQIGKYLTSLLYQLFKKAGL
jgi:hypothetical protein